MHTLTYEANLLQEYPNTRGSGLAPLVSHVQGTPLAATFSTATLFIDDCADADPLTCYGASCDTIVGNIGDRGMCWNWSAFECQPCGIGWGGANALCSQQFPACNNQCFANPSANC